MNKLWPGATPRQRVLLRRQWGFDPLTSDEEILDVIRNAPEHFARPEDPPFGRGETFYGIQPAIAIDPNNLGGKQHEGKSWVFEDILINVAGQTGAKQARTNRYCTCMCVRNVAGFALLPKRLGTLKKAMANYEFFGQVDGYAAVTAADNAFAIDEWLPAIGVPNNDLFWVVTEGPATLTTALSGTATITQFARVVALTGTTNGASDAGRVIMMDTSGATTPLANQILNQVGIACTGITAGQTNADVLVDRRVW